MNLNLKFIREITILLLLAAISGWLGYTLGTNKVQWGVESGWTPRVEVTSKLPPSSTTVDFSLFWMVWNEVFQKYVDKSKLDSQEMVYGAISGMVAALDDPYTVFLPPKENKEAKEQLNGNFEGIGAQLGIKEDRIVVVAPLSGSPAEKAGIKPGDWIIKVNGEETDKWTLPEAVGKIRGPKGTVVVLNVLHEKGEKPEDVRVGRETIILKSVEWKEVTSTSSANLKKAVYINLTRFGDQTDHQWDKMASEVSAYLATNSGKVAGMILDVRNNPGGYLAGSVYVASEFLPNGQVIVKQVSYDGTTQTYAVDRLGKLLGVPVVVLINQGTASASEILAGALQVAGRAKLVGVQSFGKGSVQQTEDLPSGAGLHITSAKWLLANGEWIQKKGLAPDVKAEADEKDVTKDVQLERAILVLNGR